MVVLMVGFPKSLKMVAATPPIFVTMQIASKNSLEVNIRNRNLDLRVANAIGDDD